MKTTVTFSEQSGRKSSVSSPKELYIKISLTEKESPATTFITLVSAALMALSSFRSRGTKPLGGAWRKSSFIG